MSIKFFKWAGLGVLIFIILTYNKLIDMKKKETYKYA